MLAYATAAIQAKQLLRSNLGRVNKKVQVSPSNASHAGAYNDADAWGWSKDQGSVSLDKCLVKIGKNSTFWSTNTRSGPAITNVVEKNYDDPGRFTNVVWAQADTDAPVANKFKRDTLPHKVKHRTTSQVAAYIAPWDADYEFSYSQILAPPSADLVDRLLNEILSLRDGWDGPGALAPSWIAKEAASSVIGQIAQYLDQAEVEVDPSIGDVSFHWFMDANNRIVSVTVQQSGRVVVVSSSADGGGTRVVLDRTRLERVGRAAVDAGLGKLHEPV